MSTTNKASTHGPLGDALQQLYSLQHRHSTAWMDTAEPAYLSNHLLECSIRALAKELSGDLIDVGCGTQPYRRYFEHVQRTVACDFDSSRGNVDFACPADRIPSPPLSFDAVLCTEVLEHVPDPLAVWREFYRVLRPGGHVLLSTPFYWPPHELPYDFYRYPEHGLRYLVTTAGFEVRMLYPRGGMWILLGQVGMHVLGHYMRARFLRKLWNRLFLEIDRRRCNPALTVGWTVLARKPCE